jgi:hypothetical protein
MHSLATAEGWMELRLNRPASDGTLVTRPVVWDDTDTGMMMAMDADGELHLLVPLAETPAAPDPPDLVALRVRRRRLDAGDYLDLVATPSHEPMFTPAANKVIEAIHVQQREPVVAAASIMRAFQMAWRPSRPLMEKSVQVGLVGELIVLKNLMLPALGPMAIHQWSGPLSERHDFVGETLHLEVKTTRKGRPEHEISRLDQLRAPAGKGLLVVSVLLEETLGGDVSLATLIDDVQTEVRTDMGLGQMFLSKVDRMGWSDEMRRSPEMLHFFVTGASVFEVDAGFPRLPDDFCPPSGVHSIRYSVSLANLPSLLRPEAITLIRAGNRELVAASGYAAQSA